MNVDRKRDNCGYYTCDLTCVCVPYQFQLSFVFNLLYYPLFFCSYIPCKRTGSRSQGWCLIALITDTVLIIQTPGGVISAKSLILNSNKNGSRLISSRRSQLLEAPVPETLTGAEPFSAARCREHQDHTSRRLIV